MLQPLHVAETRFIVQNRRINFAAYSSVRDFVGKTPVRDMFRGNLMNTPRNFLVALSGLKLTDSEFSYAQYYGMTVGSQALAYPFMTV